MTLYDLALALVMVYAAVIVLACVGWLIREPQTNSKKEISLTLIVPFRNEEKNLPRLLKSLSAQPQKFQVILVDDHSTDGSLQVIQQHVTQTGLQVLVLTNAGEGKKAASATGLKAVNTTHVFFTDADCTLDTSGVAINDRFAFLNEPVIEKAGFFYGPVIYGFDGGKTNAVFFLDQLALNGVALGLGKVGVHTYCSGAHMGGQAAALQQAIPVLEVSANLSGDDVTYLQKAVSQKQKVLALTHPALTVRTAAPGSLGEFLKQRLRWGQKATGYTGLALPALSALVWAVSCTCFIVLIACISGFLPIYWYAVPIIKLCIDLLFLFLVALRLNVPRYLWAFLPAWLLNLMYIPAIALLGMLTNMTWKGRKVKRI